MKKRYYTENQLIMLKYKHKDNLDWFLWAVNLLILIFMTLLVHFTICIKNVDKYETEAIHNQIIIENINGLIEK